MKLSKELESFMLPIWGVRVNEKGEVLEKPERFDHFLKYGDFGLIKGSELEECKAYNKATQRIKLPTLSEFIGRVDKFTWSVIEKDNGWRRWGVITEYNTFLSQPTELGQFVPAKDGVMLEDVSKEMPEE